MIDFINDPLPDAVSAAVTLGYCTVEGDHPEGVLDPSESEEYESFRDAGRRREYLATRWLIAEMVEREGLPNSQFTVEKDPFGKPFGLYKGREYHISIAHTSAHVLCALSRTMPVGVDMEPAGRNVPDRLRSRILHADEKRTLADEPTLRIWTAKEALVKLRGKGMRINLNECCITEVNETLLTATFNNDMRAKICSFKYRENWLALAWN